MNPNRLNKKLAATSLSRAVCVDLDATLARYVRWEGEKIIGPPLEGVEGFLRGLKVRGLRIIILPARLWPYDAAGQSRDVALTKERIAEWFRAHGLPFDALEAKPIAAAYVDDRAVVVPKNPAPGEFARALAEIEQLVGSES